MTCGIFYRLKFLTPVLVVAALSSPACAAGADENGLYANLGTGIALTNDPSAQDRYVVDDLELTARLETSPAWAIAGELGYKFGNIRAGLEINHQSNSLPGMRYISENGTPHTAEYVTELIEEEYTSEGVDVIQKGTSVRIKSGSFGSVRSVGLMANLAYDIPLSSVVKPYVGAGVGMAKTNITFRDARFKTDRFAWQLRAGTAFQVSRTLALTADYTYRQLGAAETTVNGFEDLETHLGKINSSLFTVGVRASL